MSAGVLRLGTLSKGRALGLLYFDNSVGAAVGVLVAGFYLLGLVGLPGTLGAAAGFNLIAGLGTLLVALLVRRTATADTSEPVVSAPPAVPGGSARRFLLVVSFGTALASFLYEIGWIRMLSLVLGSATHSFELMLSAFILGLALGAWWIRSRADRIRDPLLGLGIIQWLMGSLALATLPIYAHSFAWMTGLLETFARTDGGYLGYTVSRYGLCLAVMFPATFLAGMTLPLITRTLMEAGEGEKAVGAVYAVNTFGSIIGVALGGLVLLPWIGLKATLIVGAAIDMGLGVWLVRLHPTGRRLGHALLAGTAIVVLAGWQLVDLRKGRLTSGVYRRGSLAVPDEAVVFYRDGRTATVTGVRMGPGALTYLATNGKADASLTAEWLIPCRVDPRRLPLASDAATQTLSALIALAHAPRARLAAVIGHGSGISSHHLLASPALRRLATIEIEPEMINGSRIFFPLNGRVFGDRRSELVVDDAKSYFAAGHERYDLILSEPSNPWVSGTSGLFTTEFYGTIRRHLAPGGVFAQWLQLYELDDNLALSVLAAIHRNFPAYEIFLTTAHDILIVAGMGGTLPEPDWSVFSLPGIRQDLCRFPRFTPSTLEAARLAGRRLFGPLLETGLPVNSDFHPILDVGAEKRRYLGGDAVGLQGLSSERFSLAGLLEGRRLDLVEDPRLAVTSIPKVEANSVAAQVRADRGGAVRPRADEADAVDAIFGWRLWKESLRSETPPASWRAWLRMFERNERLTAGGAQGVADEAFYRSAYEYLARHRAPPAVRSVVDFYHGLATWNFGQVSSAVEWLLPEFRDGRFWITPDELRDGAVVARLKLGDVEGARRIFRLLAPLSARSAESLQTRLLEAHLRAGR
jgi:predicted membrane-bound spermidine synthase